MHSLSCVYYLHRIQSRRREFYLETRTHTQRLTHTHALNHVVPFYDRFTSLLLFLLFSLLRLLLSSCTRISFHESSEALHFIHWTVHLHILYPSSPDGCHQLNDFYYFFTSFFLFCFWQPSAKWKVFHHISQDGSEKRIHKKIDENKSINGNVGIERDYILFAANLFISFKRFPHCTLQPFEFSLALDWRAALIDFQAAHLFGEEIFLHILTLIYLFMMHEALISLKELLMMGNFYYARSFVRFARLARRVCLLTFPYNHWQPFPCQTFIVSMWFEPELAPALSDLIFDSIGLWVHIRRETLLITRFDSIQIYFSVHFFIATCESWLTTRNDAWFTVHMHAAHFTTRLDSTRLTNMWSNYYYYFTSAPLARSHRSTVSFSHVSFVI